MDLFETQYDWIRRTRETLFNYCETMSPEDYVKTLENFGGDSIRDLHVHVSNCYRVWLGNRALGKLLPQINPEEVNNVREVRAIFQETDNLVAEFLRSFKDNWDATYKRENGAEYTALWLFTHTTTHEFHHKGQIVKIGRQLGYVPPDTDLIEPKSAIL